MLFSSHSAPLAAFKLQEFRDHGFVLDNIPEHEQRIAQLSIAQLSPPISYIAGTGYHTATRFLSNQELAETHELQVPGYVFEKQGDVSFHDWVYKRTGIAGRNHAREDESIVSYSHHAARKALINSSLQGAEIDHIVFGSSDEKNSQREVAERVAGMLGCNSATIAYEVRACASTIFCIERAKERIANDSAVNNVLIIGAEFASKNIDFNDVGTAVLFADGAGAMVVSRKPETPRRDLSKFSGIYNTFSEYDPSLAKLIYFDREADVIRMPEGPKVYQNACKSVSKSINTVLDESGVAAADVDLFILHQANVKLLEFVTDKFNLAPEKVLSNIRYYGNSGAASPMLLAGEAAEKGIAQRGQLVVIAAVGMGMNYGAALVVL